MSALQKSQNQLRLKAAVIALTAEFLGDITGIDLPIEYELFPAEMMPAVNKFSNGVIQAVKDFGGEDLRMRPK